MTKRQIFLKIQVFLDGFVYLLVMKIGIKYDLVFLNKFFLIMEIVNLLFAFRFKKNELLTFN